MSTEPQKKPEEQQHASKGPEKKIAVAVGVVAVAVIVVVAGINAGWLTASPRENEGASPPPLPANEPPEIISVSASTDRIGPLTVVSITCDAVDPDGDELMYTWSSSDGDMKGEGPEVKWVAPDSEGLHRIFVKVEDGRGGTAEESLALRVRENRPPEILTMQSQVDEEIGWVVPGAAVYIWCEAEDPDGDELTYRWSANEGEIFGQGSAVIWLAPEELATHWVVVTVDDSHGGEAKRAIPITVSEAKPPVIHGFNVKAIRHNQLSPRGVDQWLVFMGRSCAIEALVDDDDLGYTYKWSADGGTITSDGPNAEWQAPAGKAKVTILLQVSDAHGNSSSASVYIEVTTCPLCV